VPTLAPVNGSSEALAARRTQEMLRELKSVRRDGLVIFDLPPVLLADDFLTVAPLLDGVVLVACEGLTRREDVIRTRELMGSVRLLGSVLNRASESEKRAY
jgi:Mrp family chromosome partitioning ATPase